MALVLSSLKLFYIQGQKDGAGVFIYPGLVYVLTTGCAPRGTWENGNVNPPVYILVINPNWTYELGVQHTAELTTFLSDPWI